MHPIIENNKLAIDKLCKDNKVNTLIFFIKQMRYE